MIFTAYKIILQDFIVFFCFEIGSSFVAQTGIKSVAILAEPPECVFRNEPPGVTWILKSRYVRKETDWVCPDLGRVACLVYLL